MDQDTKHSIRYQRKVKMEKKEILIKWKNDHISLNDWYGSKHWTVRQKAKNKWCKIFKELLNGGPAVNFSTYDITLTYNSRLDSSNTIAMIKICEDTMVKLGIIKDDTKQYCKGVHLIPDETLGKKHYIIKIREL